MRDSSHPPLIAYLCMALGATGLTLGDFFIKKASIAGVSFATLLVFAAPFTLIALAFLSHLQGGIRFHLAPRAPKKLLVRALLLLVMSWLNITSLSLNPYVMHAMLFKLSLVFVLIIGIVFLKERASTVVMIALAVCLAGTCMILNPGVKGISLTLLIAVAAALSNAATNSFVAANKKAASPIGFTFWAVAGVLAVVLPYWVLFERTFPEPSAQVWIQLSAVMAITGILFASIAMQLANGNTGKVGIMLYVQMPVALVLARLAFGERPPNMAILGGILIMMAGASIPLLSLPKRKRVNA